MRLPWRSSSGRDFPGYWFCSGKYYPNIDLVPLDVDLDDCEDRCACEVYRRKFYKALRELKFRRAYRYWKYGLIRMFELAPEKEASNGLRELQEEAGS